MASVMQDFFRKKNKYIILNNIGYICIIVTYDVHNCDKKGTPSVLVIIFLLRLSVYQFE